MLQSFLSLTTNRCASAPRVLCARQDDKQGCMLPRERLSNPLRLKRTFCIISDVQIRGMSDLEMQLSLIERGYAIPIIPIPAFSDDAIRARFRQRCGCFLAKRVDTNDII